ncbi:MAG: CHAD domain-containing protein [Candidatus Melainabacteria bacterium]|nr:CHAD domain-containing protein [Candidatus Melainabacteria bacterium]
MSSKIKHAPEHLIGVSWLSQEESRALHVMRDIEKSLGKAHKKLTLNRVHEIRVVLRRWYSIWDILCLDRWQDDQYEKRIGRTFKELNKQLGKLRDIDVNIALAKEYSLPEAVILLWVKKRKRLTKVVGKKIGKLKLHRAVNSLKTYMARKAHELAQHLAFDKDELKLSINDSAYHHMVGFLEATERVAHEQAKSAITDEELHQLRLSVKRWRYILAEFFGLTNLELVLAQQLLGKHHDLTLLKEALESTADKLGNKRIIGLEEAKSRLVLELRSLNEEIVPLRDSLPYGLRPSTSFEPTR